MAYDSTGFGVTDKDRENGIERLSDKFNLICPYYEEMDEVFGNRADINPLYEEDAQASEHEESLIDPALNNYTQDVNDSTQPIEGWEPVSIIVLNFG